MKRGLGSDKMTPEDRARIASMGGKAAQEKGTAHRFTSEKAREAGKAGGMNRKVSAFTQMLRDLPVGESVYITNEQRVKNLSRLYGKKYGRFSTKVQDDGMLKLTKESA